MSYSRLTWVTGGPPARSATNLNHAEAGIQEASDRLDAVEPAILGAYASDLILYVSPSGNDANSGLTWRAAKQTLAAAITALSSGGCIEIAGVHTITSPLPQPADNTVIRGRGPTTRLVFNSSGVMCTLTDASQIHFADMRVSLVSAFGQAFEFDNSFRCTLRNVIVDGLHNTGTGSTYHGQVGLAFRGNAGDNGITSCDFNNLGEAIQSSEIMNWVIRSNICNNWRGLHLDGGTHSAGMMVIGCTFQGTAIGAAQVQAHVLVDVNANLLTLEDCWFEGCTTAVQLGSGTVGPTGATIRNCKLAATTQCLDIQAASQTKLDQIVFSSDPGQTPTELTINATNAPEGTASGLISAQIFDFSPSAFPAGWSFAPRYASIDRLRTYTAVTPRTGRYFCPVGTGRGDTDDLPYGVLVCSPWLLGAPVTISRIGVDVHSAGDAASKIRLGIFADAGNYHPGALILDAGPNINGDSATVQEITISQALSPGIYWLGAVAQSGVTTRPFVRVPFSYEPPISIAMDSTIPDPNWTFGAVAQTGVTAALPSTFTATVAGNRRVPRIFLKAA